MDIVEWQSEVYTRVISQNADQQVFELFQKFITQIADAGTLLAPLTNSTNQFLDEFSPSIISTIFYLTGPLDQLFHSRCQSVLEQYATLLASQLVSDHDKFVSAAAAILLEQRKSFYLIDFPRSCMQSSRYNRCCDAFAKAVNFARFEYASDISIQKLKLIINIFSRVSFRSCSAQLDTFLVSAVSKIGDSLASLPIRSIDEKKFDKCFSCIETMASGSHTRKRVAERGLRIATILIESGTLVKQLAGVAFVHKMLVSGSIDAQAVRPLANYLLTRDLHHELVSDFAGILGRVSLPDCEPFAKFWQITVNSHQSVIDSFLRGVDTIIKHISSKRFFPIVLQTNKFPDAVLKFVCQYAPRCLLKREMFTTLWKLVEEKGHIPRQRKHLLIDAMRSFCPTDDSEFCSNFQNDGLKLIAKKSRVDIVLPLLSKSTEKISPERADMMLDSILKLMNEKSTEYLDLLLSLMRHLSHQVRKEQYESIESLILGMISHEPASVCSFLRKLTSNSVALAPVMVDRLFEKLCQTPSFSPDLFEFLKAKYESSNGLISSDRPGIEGIWEFLFRTGCPEVAEYLLNCYFTMNSYYTSRDYALDYLNMCQKNLSTKGALLAIDKFIHAAEDGYCYETNRFVFDDDYVSVTLNGVINISVMVLSDISFEGFRRVVAEFLEIRNFRLSVDGRSLNKGLIASVLQGKLPVLVEADPKSAALSPIMIRPSEILKRPDFQERLMTILKISHLCGEVFQVIEQAFVNVHFSSYISCNSKCRL
jgi:hypothetical protein